MSTCNCTIRPPREESVGPVAIFYGVPANLLAPHSVLCNRSPVISHDRTGSNNGGEGFYRRRGREICGGVINWRRLATFRTPGARRMGGVGVLGVMECQSSGVQACATQNMRRGWKPADTWQWMGPASLMSHWSIWGHCVLDCRDQTELYLWLIRPKNHRRDTDTCRILSFGYILSYLSVRESKSHPVIIKSHHDLIINLIIWLLTFVTWLYLWNHSLTFFPDTFFFRKSLIVPPRIDVRHSSCGKYVFVTASAAEGEFIFDLLV